MRDGAWRGSSAGGCGWGPSSGGRVASRCVRDSRVRRRACFAWVPPGPGGCKSRILLPAGLVSSEAASRCVEGCLLAASSPSSLEPPGKATYPAREGSAFTAPSPPRGLVSAAVPLGAASPRCPGPACPVCRGKGSGGALTGVRGAELPRPAWLTQGKEAGVVSPSSMELFCAHGSVVTRRRVTSELLLLAPFLPVAWPFLLFTLPRSLTCPSPAVL